MKEFARCSRNVLTLAKLYDVDLNEQRLVVGRAVDEPIWFIYTRTFDLLAGFGAQEGLNYSRMSYLINLSEYAPYSNKVALKLAKKMFTDFSKWKQKAVRIT